MMRDGRTLRGYLAALALVLIVPLLVGLVGATWLFVVAERARLDAMTDKANRDISTHVELELATRVTMLEALAGTASLPDGNVDTVERQLREISRQTGVALLLFDPAGRLLVDTLSPPGASLPDVTDLEMVRDAVIARKATVSNLIVGDTGRPHQTRIAMPVIRGGHVVAVLVSPFGTKQLGDILSRRLPGGPFFATILDRTGVILARSIAPERFVGKPFPALAAQTTGRSGSIYLVNPQGVPIVGHYRRSGLSDWLVVAAIERAALMAPLTRSLWALVLTAAGLVTLATVGGWWVSRALTRAHRTLLDSAAALGQGQIITPAPTALYEVNMVDEALAAASRSIARQAHELRQANRELEERVRARTEELARKTGLLMTTLDAMKQGLIVIEADGRVTVSNPQARRMLGLPEAFMERQPTLDEVFALEGRAGHFSDITADTLRLIKTLVTDQTFERQRRDGTVLEVQTMPINGPGGFVRTYTDITEHRRRQREVEEARDIAQRANRAKDDFLATMSHEMRTPLNAVIGYSDLLLRVVALDHDTRRYAEQIRNAATALLCLVDDILDIGMIEAGLFDIRAEPFPLAALVEDAVSMVRPFAIEKGLTLRVSLAGDGPGFYLGDQERLRQVLLNLLNNAIKFTLSGAVSLSVSERSEAGGRQLLRFAVTDTGIGIDKAEQAAIFQRFHQIDPATDRQYGGVGLGLAIAQQLVERMGGTIGVSSALGRGATFWFELALVPAALVETASCDVPVPPRCARILVAEDVTVNQELARELLENAGHEVDIVGGGAEAVAAVKAGGYDLVLMDLSMPGMDGLTATRLIRQAETPSSSIPIVACTANVLPAQVAALKNAGVDAYLRKPLRRMELWATIARILARDDPAGMNGQGAGQDGETARDDALDIIALLGPKRIVAALDMMTDELKSLAAVDPSDAGGRGKLADRAHAMISTASILGMTELAETCREIENACRGEEAVAGVLARLGPVSASALANGDRLRRDIAQAG